MTATQLSGGEAMAAAVKANGIECVFGLPGAQIYPLFDGFHAAGVEVVVPRHEQTAAYMAMGYAKSSGRTGTFAVVPGPGVLNTTAALCTAMGNCSPVLCLTGQVPSAYLGKGRGALHELRDQAGTLRTLIKDALPIGEAAAAGKLIGEAVRLAHGGRPGPVAVEMCWDTMAQRASVAPAETAALDAPLEPEPDAIAAAARLIAAARRPMIMCGAGAQHAAAEVRAFAELLQAPVTAFRSGRGVVPEDHPLGVASVAARELWDDVDLLIGVGSRLEMPFMRWSNPMRYEPKPGAGPRLIRIDIDPDEMQRLIPDVAVVGDAALACRRLVDVLAARVSPDAGRVEEIARARRTAAELIGRIRPHAQYLEAIRDVLPRDGFLVPELSQAGFTTYTGAFPVLEPRSYVTEGFQGTLGFGFPTALGVKAAHPERAVVSITGDGGFMFAAQELATAAQYGLDIVVIVYNNGAFGNVLRDQQQQFDGHIVGSRLENPDFVKLAESFGIEARRVADPAALREALELALAGGRPALIEIELDLRDETPPWPLIHMQQRPSTIRL